jgi:regulator of sirC expression with transglutaminase-like and TPR domain
MKSKAALSRRPPLKVNLCNNVTTLEDIGALDDEAIDIAQAALLLAARQHQQKPTGQYHHHLKKLSDNIHDRFTTLISEGAKDNAETRLAALKHVLHDVEGYAGDTENYDDLDNANLMRVIDRRKGLPIAIALLYIYAGRTQGWTLDALNFPGHVLVRLEHDGTRLIFDPFHGCKLMQAADLRALLKATMGPQAELSVSYYDTASNRDVLMRLQNNIKLRQIEAEDYAGALDTVQAMRVIAPKEARLLFDEAILSAKTGHPQAAIVLLEQYLGTSLSARERQDVSTLLAELRAMVN